MMFLVVEQEAAANHSYICFLYGLNIGTIGTAGNSNQSWDVSDDK